MLALEAGTIQSAVMAICPDIEARVYEENLRLSEHRLWWELSVCLLSSQAPFDLALAAADAIEDAGICLVSETGSVENLAVRIERVLERPLVVCGRKRSYRFPAVKSVQLACTWRAVTEEAGGIAALLQSSPDATTVRAWLVANAPGLGPKQASMFLRNVGVSYNLAVLDRHVLSYMAIVGLSDGSKRYVSGLGEYCKYEHSLREHANSIGYPVGLLDWAIWIVMRAAGKQQGTGATA